jgi:hypothetical protein
MVACQWNYRIVSGLSRRGFLVAASSSRPYRQRRPSRGGSCTKSDVPDHLRWGQLSRRREGRYGSTVSQMSQPAWCCQAAPLHPTCTAPHVRVKEQAALSTEGKGHVPTEVRKLLVDALESHGYCAGLFVVRECSLVRVRLLVGRECVLKSRSGLLSVSVSQR